ncbi:hypothetical protein TrRE_jg2566 [Triparma retinervis]|uniref:Uncharacterized protein n=1 Tax=Triparma retinervis TaxID=2557542 RepID=A0A9W7DZT1_9STRA|nr:hypothetical protein TrRE_jg2566 [Triparma retinervis]
MNVLTTALLRLCYGPVEPPELLACLGLTCKNHHEASSWKCRDLINLVTADEALRSALGPKVDVPSFEMEGCTVADISHPDFWALKDSILSSEVALLLKTGALGVDLLPILECIYYADDDEDPAVLIKHRNMCFLALSRCWDLLHVVTAEELCKAIIGVGGGSELEVEVRSRLNLDGVSESGGEIVKSEPREIVQSEPREIIQSEHEYADGASAWQGGVESRAEIHPTEAQGGGHGEP